MALTGVAHISPQQLAVNSGTQELPLGTRMMGEDGNEYIYLQGVASTIVGSWVTFDEAGLTTLTVADAVGSLGIAMSACVANEFGWYQIFGSATGASADDVADNAAVYLTATAGKCDDAVVAGDRVKGAARWRAAGTGATTVAVQIAYPYADDIAD